MSRPAFVTAAEASRPPLESSNEALRAIFTGVFVEVPSSVRVPLSTCRKPPPTVPETSTAPVLVVSPSRCPVTAPPLSAAPPVAVRVAVPAMVPPLLVSVAMVSEPERESVVPSESFTPMVFTRLLPVRTTD